MLVKNFPKSQRAVVFSARPSRWNPMQCERLRCEQQLFVYAWHQTMRVIDGFRCLEIMPLYTSNYDNILDILVSYQYILYLFCRVPIMTNDPWAGMDQFQGAVFFTTKHSTTWPLLMDWGNEFQYCNEVLQLGNVFGDLSRLAWQLKYGAVFCWRYVLKVLFNMVWLAIWSQKSVKCERVYCI